MTERSNSPASCRRTEVRMTPHEEVEAAQEVLATALRYPQAVVENRRIALLALAKEAAARIRELEATSDD